MAIDDLFSGESKNIEYKAMVPEKSEKYMKTVIAFANTQGGKLIIGVDDRTHQVVGVNNDDLFQIIFHFQKHNVQYLREQIVRSFWINVNLQDRFINRLKML